MPPAHVLTIGGKPGPEGRADVLDAITAFERVYRVSPRAMAVPAAGLAAMRRWDRDPLPDRDFDDVIGQSGRVTYCGLTLSVGPAYQLTD